MRYPSPKIAVAALSLLAATSTLPLFAQESPTPAPAPARQAPRQFIGEPPDPSHPTMAIGAPLPSFSLPGIDGKMHTQADYAGAKLLVIVFESNHCPVSIAYEERIKELYEAYKNKGVALIAVNPNNPSAVQLSELGYTDASDSQEEMKVRARLRHIDWPYLYDGETQSFSSGVGAAATPHIFIFDQDRKLRYQGRIDDSTDVRKVTKRDAHDAIEALLAGQPVAVPSTPHFGCSTKWLTKSTGVKEEMAKIQTAPVTLTPASVDDIKKLRANAGDKTVVVVFWSTKCRECLDEMLEYQNTYRMYRRRKFDLVTVSTDRPADSDKVLQVLKQQYASTTNLQFNSADMKALYEAVDERWKANAPFVMVLGPGGNVVYQKAGPADILDVRRNVLASIPNDGPWFGVQEYWTNVIKASSEGKVKAASSGE